MSQRTTSTSIRSILVGAPLISSVAVLVVLLMVGNNSKDHFTSTASAMIDTVEDAVRVERLQNGIADSHIRLHRTLLWTAMNVDDVRPREIAERIHTEIAALRRLHGSAMRSAEHADPGLHSLMNSIDAGLARYDKNASEILAMAAADPAMASLFMSRAEDNYQALQEAVNRLSSARIRALTTQLPHLLDKQAAQRDFSFLAILAALALSLVVTIWAARSIAAPIAQLTLAMTRSRSGVPASLPAGATQRGDEIGAMARAFLSLEQARRDSDAALRRNREDLEALIAARTAEVNLANAELRQQIEERASVDAALRRSEQEHRDILDGSLQGAYMLHGTRLIYANDAFSRMLGYASPDQLLALPRGDLLVAPEDRQRIADRYAESVHGEELVGHTAFRMLTRDGRAITVLNTARAVEWQGKKVTLCFAVDISDREAARQAAEQMRDEALAAARAKSDFLANMSHEIRTPMNGVVGAVSLLEGTDLNAEQRKLTSVARVSGTALLDLIDNILDFSKIEAGHLNLESIPLRPRDLAEDAIDICAMRAFSKGVDLYCVESPGLPLWLRGDPGRVRQIITNLVSNAVKFTHTGHVRLGLAAAGEHWQITVSDTGVGIASDKLPQVFDAFMQEDGSTTRNFGGTGLGLAICRRLVEAMQGEIKVDSTPGMGTVFTVTLPAGTADQASGADEVAGELQGRRVALGCAHPGLRQDLSQLLTGRFGMTIVKDGDASALPECRLLVETGIEACSDIDPASPALPLIEAARNPLCTEAEGTLVLKRPVRAQMLRETLISALSTPAQAGSERSDTADTDTTPLAGLRVLVVDDVLVNRLVACKMLESMGAITTSVENGEEAVASASAHVFDLVLMDCQMPLMDGYEATRRIRALSSANAQVPVIALTAHALKGDDERCYEAGMTDYMTKPLSMDTLQAKLQEWSCRAAVA